jgi:hypothetical protein
MDFVTESGLNDALADVQAELAEHDLWRGVRRTDVIWCAFPQFPLGALGFFIHSTYRWVRFLGYFPGHIYVPAFSICDRRIRDVLRHEYGHALAHYHRRSVDGDAFRFAFGGGYFSEATRPRLRRGDCVSRYAMTSPMEDFAETFMLFLRRAGRPPKQLTERLERKWNFVANLRKLAQVQKCN